MTEIERGIPIPDIVKRESKYAFWRLRPGDSVVMDKRGRSAALRFAEYHGLDFVTRSLGGGKYRVWRVA